MTAVLRMALRDYASFLGMILVCYFVTVGSSHQELRSKILPCVENETHQLVSGWVVQDRTCVQETDVALFNLTAVSESGLTPGSPTNLNISFVQGSEDGVKGLRLPAGGTFVVTLGPQFLLTDYDDSTDPSSLEALIDVDWHSKSDGDAETFGGQVLFDNNRFHFMARRNGFVRGVHIHPPFESSSVTYFRSARGLCQRNSSMFCSENEDCRRFGFGRCLEHKAPSSVAVQVFDEDGNLQEMITQRCPVQVAPAVTKIQAQWSRDLQVLSETPTSTPTGTPTGSPTGIPTGAPTEIPTGTPTGTPTSAPTENPTGTPTSTPTGSPTGTPTRTPTSTPTGSPSGNPTVAPTGTPTSTPTVSPTGSPSAAPTGAPTGFPTVDPSGGPTSTPTGTPSGTPTRTPSATPTGTPTSTPTSDPSGGPTGNPTDTPTGSPTGTTLTENPTATPTFARTAPPTGNPTGAPTGTSTSTPTATPTDKSTGSPTWTPTSVPTRTPTATPTGTPTYPRTASPTSSPSTLSPATERIVETGTPTLIPTSRPTDHSSCSESNVSTSSSKSSKPKGRSSFVRVKGHRPAPSPSSSCGKGGKKGTRRHLDGHDVRPHTLQTIKSKPDAVGTTTSDWNVSAPGVESNVRSVVVETQGTFVVNQVTLTPESPSSATQWRWFWKTGVVSAMVVGLVAVVGYWSHVKRRRNAVQGECGMASEAMLPPVCICFALSVEME